MVITHGETEQPNRHMLAALLKTSSALKPMLSNSLKKGGLETSSEPRSAGSLTP